MVHKNLEFHNVAQLEGVSGGLKLQRFPKSVRESLGYGGHQRGRIYAPRAAGCELRFVADEGALLRLAAQGRDAKAWVYRGDFFHSEHLLLAGGEIALRLQQPADFPFVKPAALRGERFSPAMWRVTFNQDAEIVFHSLETSAGARAPLAKEKPRTRWLAYGSSITFGGNALLYASSYVEHTARLLGVDALNKGLPGSCLCERAVAEYLAGEDWEFATLEIGVNMVSVFGADAFHQQVSDFLNVFADNLRGRLVFIVDILPNKYAFARNASDPSAVRTKAFNEILRDLVEGLRNPNIRLIDGRRILQDLRGLVTDLVHPSDEGHMAMGENLAATLRQEAGSLFERRA